MLTPSDLLPPIIRQNDTLFSLDITRHPSSNWTVSYVEYDDMRVVGWLTQGIATPKLDAGIRAMVIYLAFGRDCGLRRSQIEYWWDHYRPLTGSWITMVTGLLEFNPQQADEILIKAGFPTR